MSPATSHGKKGIILAGGAGTRLDPLTRIACKQLLPVYDKPMIYYPLSVLMLGDISEILIISTPKDLPMFRELFGDGSHLGLAISYEEQAEPRGLAEALIIGEEFLDGAGCCLILGDNLFHGNLDFFREALQIDTGAAVFAKEVRDPERFGVVEFDAAGTVLSLEEKPTAPKSRFAVPGLYVFDPTASARAKALAPSPRGELEIVDLIKTYLADTALVAKSLGRGVAWLDTGTPESLLEASNYIATLQTHGSVQVACLEEIAYTRGFIDRDAFVTLAQNQTNPDRRKYLLSRAD